MLENLDLVDLLLLVDRETAGAHVGEEDEAADNREGLEKVVLRKSRWGCAECTLHQLLMRTLKIESMVTRNDADHFALKPIATMTQAMRPKTETITRETDQVPWKMKPMKRKMRRMRPASWKLRELEGALKISTHYLRRSVSLIEGRPAKMALFLCWSESERTMRRPPTTERLRRKNDFSKRRP